MKLMSFWIELKRNSGNKQYSNGRKRNNEPRWRYLSRWWSSSASWRRFTDAPHRREMVSIWSALVVDYSFLVCCASFTLSSLCTVFHIVLGNRLTCLCALWKCVGTPPNGWAVYFELPFCGLVRQLKINGPVLRLTRTRLACTGNLRFHPRPYIEFASISGWRKVTNKNRMVICISNGIAYFV